jgi:hypothetical protein
MSESLDELAREAMRRYGADGAVVVSFNAPSGRAVVVVADVAASKGHARRSLHLSKAAESLLRDLRSR